MPAYSSIAIFRGWRGQLTLFKGTYHTCKMHIIHVQVVLMCGEKVLICYTHILDTELFSQSDCSYEDRKFKIQGRVGFWGEKKGKKAGKRRRTFRHNSSKKLFCIDFVKIVQNCATLFIQCKIYGCALQYSDQSVLFIARHCGGRAVYLPTSVSSPAQFVAWTEHQTGLESLPVLLLSHH